jgi:hypothetical protein
MSHLAHFGSHLAMSHGGWRLFDPPRRLAQDEVANLAERTAARDRDQCECAREERVRAIAAEERGTKGR